MTQELPESAEFPNLSDGCPPTDVEEANNHEVFRVVANPISEEDFYSYYVMKKTAFDDCQGQALSVYLTLEGV